MTDLFSKCAHIARLDGIKNVKNPYLRQLETRQDTKVVMQGKERIMMGSNNYLGLTTNTEIIETAKAALDQYGTGCSGSRLLNGTLNLHVQLEEELSRFLGKEKVMTFSAGYNANVAAISALVGKNDFVICDKENHASIYAGIATCYGKVLRYNHNDMEQLERCLQKVPESAGCLIVTDGIFSMTGDIANLPEIVRLAKAYGARVMVDDAHCLGVIGKGGRGAASYFGLEQDIDLYVGTFSKSLASVGGYIATDAQIIDYITYNSSPFMFSASMTPVTTAIALASLHYLEAHPELVDRLQELAKFAYHKYEKYDIPIMKSNIREFDDVTYIPILSIMTGSQEHTMLANERIYESGVYVNPVIPPACPLNQCLLRTSLMATLDEELIETAILKIKNVL